MKIGLYSLAEVPLGKHNIGDSRLDQIHKIANSKKKTYLQVELTGGDNLLEADAILVLNDSRADLILKDLEFIQTRLERSQDDREKNLLEKLMSVLEKEEFIFNAGLNDEEKAGVSGYGLLTNRPVISASKDELQDMDLLLSRAVKECGFISFFTAGEKEARAWLIKKGTNAWEAAGAIHSDIQKGFIRAEIIGFDDFIQAGGETRAKQEGKLRLEQRQYLIQDGDLANFRFNK
ncbi:MAG: DUF933 domain-containing protein [Candidatus Omnitrophota bacterium]|nr:DUF933 domain-containing protein [Candidatus Omnitrophota bacterium]